ncbi:MAG: phosphate acyltransferase PlsX [Candidatus Omnitrophica bacterium]|nr:phosphate acyltransferase PlsX [Candidatus Omnitrophota bacterium]
MRYRIGLDVSGGDHAPEEIIKGALLAREEVEADIVLIGVKEEIEEEASRQKIDLHSLFDVVDAPERIEMDAAPALSVRRQRRSSIVIGHKLIKEGKLDAFVSCGNTGAMVCAATLSLGLIEGVERPGIAISLPTKQGVSLLMDVGANIGPKPLHLLQYGVMASVYSQIVFDKPNPSIGLLNIGEEASKGSDFSKNVHRMFTASALNFSGNLEAKRMFQGASDCIICDGLIGNIALKVSEGCVEVMAQFTKDIIKKDPLAMIGSLLMKRTFSKLKKKLDYAEYGGAPLLGVDGISIIAHGSSNSRAVKNAVKVAAKELNRNINKEIKRKIDEVCQDSRIREMLTV